MQSTVEEKKKKGKDIGVRLAETGNRSCSRCLLLHGYVGEDHPATSEVGRKNGKNQSPRWRG